MNDLIQFIIFISGIGVAITVGRKDKWRRWSYIIMLLVQPFWFYTSYVNKQWGVFLTCVVYLYGAIEGFRNYWLNDEYSKKN